jgi:amidophosphoribosyltransferase
MGIGVISDTDAQPIVLFSHLGRFALVMTGKINNTDE